MERCGISLDGWSSLLTKKQTYHSYEKKEVTNRKKIENPTCAWCVTNLKRCFVFVMLAMETKQKHTTQADENTVLFILTSWSWMIFTCFHVDYWHIAWRFWFAMKHTTWTKEMPVLWSLPSCPWVIFSCFVACILFLFNSTCSVETVWVYFLCLCSLQHFNKFILVKHLPLWSICNNIITIYQ